MTTPQMNTQDETLTAKTPPNSDHVIDYIAQMLGELSEMAAEIGNTELADLIRFSARAAIMEKSKYD